jgi:hypothetical protein
MPLASGKSKPASEAITTAAQGLHHRAAHRSLSQGVAREAVIPVCQYDGLDLNRGACSATGGVVHPHLGERQVLQFLG